MPYQQFSQPSKKSQQTNNQLPVSSEIGRSVKSPLKQPSENQNKHITPSPMASGIARGVATTEGEQAHNLSSLSGRLGDDLLHPADRFHAQQSARPSAPKNRVALPLGSIANNSSATGKTRETRGNSDFRPLDAYWSKLVENPKYRHQDGLYILLRTARKLLRGSDEKILDCGRIETERFNVEDRIELIYHPDRHKVSYGGLVRCESRSCPCCGYIKAEETRTELSALMASVQQQGFYAYLVTVTLSHTMRDTLAYSRGVLQSAWAMLTSGRLWSRFADDNMILGFARTSEEPFGKNGFHPHYHVLMISELELVGNSLGKFEQELQARWSECVRAKGGKTVTDIALKVDIADSAIADYISKYGREPSSASWGADSEMTHGNMKTSPSEYRKSFTPIELLKVASVEPSDTKDDFCKMFGLTTGQARQMAGQKWLEHYWTMKGKRRVDYSKGLNDRFDIEAKVKELREAKEQLENAQKIVLACVDVPCWHRRVMFNHAGNDDLRAELLTFTNEAIKAQNTDELNDFMTSYDLSAGITWTPEFIALVNPVQSAQAADTGKDELRLAIHPPTIEASPPADLVQMELGGLVLFNRTAYG